MKHIATFKIFLVAVLLSVTATTRAYTLANETLYYDIIYHWGLIWKHAGSATLSMKHSGNYYNAVLAARTVSWADKIFTVRDTLSCTLQPQAIGFRPMLYRKASHEGDHTGTDIVKYSYADNTCLAECTRIRPEKANQVIKLQAKGQAYDMLSIFYFLRSLDFKAMTPNKNYATTIFSGKKKETLRIKLVGTETIELRDNSKHQAYHISFTFTTDGQTKSSDDMHTWISTDASHKPLMMKGKLPIGEVRCYLHS